MRVFADTNVLLDVLVFGRPNAEQSSVLFRLAQKGDIELHMSTQSIIDAAYVCSRCPGYDALKFRSAIASLLGYVNVGGIGYYEILNAVKALDVSDVEDCAQAFYSDGRNCDVIVSGDNTFHIPDKAAPVPVMTPSQFISNLR